MKHPESDDQPAGDHADDGLDDVIRGSLLHPGRQGVVEPASIASAIMTIGDDCPV